MVVCVFLVLASALTSASAQGSDVDGAYGGYGGYGDDGAYAGRTPPPSGRLDVALFKGSKGAVRSDCDCPADVEYVCGSDGNTYDNACMAECAGVVPVFQGICYHGCMCPSTPDPSCLAPEQTTFRNGCLYGCKISEANVFADFLIPGECTGACAHCPRDYATVCDVSPEGAGNEYVNACYAECAGVTQWEEGSCDKLDGLVPADCGCSDGSGGVFNIATSGAVCGKDGVTYENACVANCNSAAIAYSGPCETDCGSCVARGGPEVCGMDGITYMNTCEARCAPVEVDSALEGPCADRARGCGCSAEVLEPVCGASRSTYMNRCFADCAADAVESVGPCEYDSENDDDEYYGTVVYGAVVSQDDSEE